MQLSLQTIHSFMRDCTLWTQFGQVGAASEAAETTWIRSSRQICAGFRTKGYPTKAGSGRPFSGFSALREIRKSAVQERPGGDPEHLVYGVRVGCVVDRQEVELAPGHRRIRHGELEDERGGLHQDDR